MKLLLDECMPIDFRLLLTGHDAITVAYMGWKGVKNGKLLALAAGAGFDALLTTDAGIERQQNPSTLPVAIIILHSLSNDIDDLAALVPELLRTLPAVPPRSVRHVP